MKSGIINEEHKILQHLKTSVMEQKIIGYWNKKKEKIKEKFPEITDVDLSYSEGKENVMMDILGYKLGKSKLELISIIVDL